MNIDYFKFAGAIHYYMLFPEKITDLYTDAVRRATGDSTIVLTAAQRRQVKMAAQAVIYGMSGEKFIDALKRIAD